MGWGDNGNGDGNGTDDLFSDGDGMGFGYDVEEEPVKPTPKPRSRLSENRAPSSKPAPTPTPVSPPTQQSYPEQATQPRRRARPPAQLGETDMGWVASYVDQNILTPEFIHSQLVKVVSDPSLDKAIFSKMIPYYPFMIAAGLTIGVVGGWLISEWGGFSYVKNVAKRLLA